MKRKSITLYSVTISLVFTFAVGFFAFNIYSELKTGSVRAKKLFDSLSLSIKNMKTDEELSKIISNSENYAALYISKDGKTLTAYPDPSSEYAESTKLVKVFKVTVSNNESVFNITAAIYILRPSIIFYYARFSFIIIMIATLLTTVLIIYFSITEKNTAVTEDDLKISFDNVGIYTDEQQTDTTDTAVLNDTQEYPEEINFSERQEPDTGSSYEEIQETVRPAEETAVMTEENDKSPVAEKTDSSETEYDNIAEQPFSMQIEENEAKDIFSPVTGFCWETQLKPRLETELVRAGSSEQDLSLFLIKIPGLSFTDELTKDITAYLLKEIQFRDKLFEYSNDSFAIIKIETSIDEAEIYAETLQKKISEIVRTEKKDCFIGISSRSIRMLSAERLVMEADEALKHAENDESSKIIGFHVDIEKYRQFIKNS